MDLYNSWYISYAAHDLQNRLVALVGTTLIRYNPDGSVDTTFGSKGSVDLKFHAENFSGQICILSDGSVAAILNNAFYTNSHLVVCDTTGKIRNDISINFAQSQFVASFSIAADSKDNIYIAGYGAGQGRGIGALVKVTSLGAIDTTFGNNGVLNTNLSGNGANISSVTILDSGKILVAGFSSIDYSFKNVLSRINIDGSLDTNFFANGFYESGVLDGATFSKILMGKDGSQYYVEGDFKVTKFDSTGARDLTFGIEGIAKPALNVILAASSTFISSDDKLVIVGNTYVQRLDGYWDADIIVCKYNMDGTLDSSFSDDGIGIFDINQSDFATSAFELSDGKIIVSGGSGGHTDNNWNNDDSAFTCKLAVKINQDGTADTSFILGTDRPENLGGTAANDTVSGLGGNDTLVGGIGDDTLIGGNGNDTLIGGNDDDVIIAGAGIDLIIGGDGAGNDDYNGGDGEDTVKYTSARAGIRVDFSKRLGTATSIGGNDASGIGEDTLTDIENVIGGNYDDIIIGSAIKNNLYGENGDDRLIGMSGKDLIDGGEGNDTADFSDKKFGVAITLNGVNLTSALVDGKEEDRLVNIENIMGGSGDDLFIGDANDNSLSGGAGNDLLRGAAGNDALDGGFNIDTADYSDKTDAVVVILDGSNLVNVSVGGIAEDTLCNIENLIGGTGDDLLTGDGNPNLLVGGAGDDILKGCAGKDILDGGIGVDTADYSDQTQSVTVTLNGTIAAKVSINKVAEDTIKNIENFIGGAGNDLLVGDALSNQLIGGLGNDSIKSSAGRDTLDGGEGVDTVDYSNQVKSLNIVLMGASETTTMLDGVAKDTLRNVENIIGGSGNDMLTGDVNANSLIGGTGNDVIKGGLGNDRLIGGKGADQFVFTALDSKDVITDFSAKDKDKLGLAASVFNSLANGISPGNLAMNNTGISSDGDDFLIFNTSNKTLYYDADGNGATYQAIAVAELLGISKLAHTDFLVLSI